VTLRVEREQVVTAAPQDVYALVADLPGRPRWLHELRRVDTSASPAVAGDRFEGESDLLLHRFSGCSEVVRAEPGIVLTERVHLGARFVSEWTFSPLGDGSTRVRHCIEVALPGGPLHRLERWVLRRRVAALQRRGLAGLAALAER
jgi:uncharacterized membrane protein